MKKLNVLFYGLSHEHAAGKLRTIRKMSGAFNLIGVVDDRKAAEPYFANDPATTEGVPVLTPEEALARNDIDVVFVETTNRFLMDIAAKFVARGIPLHCDKPCGEAMEPYRTLLETCRAKNIPFQIGYMYRGNPALKFAWNAVKSGWLGKVAFIEADMNHDYGTAGYEAYISSFKGGILYNLGCHLMDMIAPMVTGDPLDVKTYLDDAPGDPVGSRTCATSLLHFKDVNVLLRTSSHMPGGILCRRLRIDGTNGTLEICPIERFDGGNLKLAMTLNESAGGYGAGHHELDFGILSDRYMDQLEDLAAIVRGDKPNDQDYDRDLRVHALTLKACGLI